MNKTNQSHIFLDGDKLKVIHAYLDGVEAWIFSNIYGLDERFCSGGRYVQYQDYTDNTEGVRYFAEKLGVEYEIDDRIKDENRNN